MDNLKNDKYYLRKLIEDTTFIVKHMKDVSLHEFNQDEILQDSMMFRMIQISENASRLSEGFTLKHNAIPWHAIRGLRNRIVHDYGNVDLSIVYDTVSMDIPRVNDTLARLKCDNSD
ncbi:MAG TPA: DUF86 domain-containing protein [Bacillota bacterium]|jgi:uncharacterized protein with HEPN domain|nr:DUF86 domain-containing protein [Bacillota bacterium]HQC48817.1 DUF86 domain-containing protein [Bacillota bacterium]